MTGSAVAQEVEQVIFLSEGPGLIRNSSGLHVEVFLGKMLSPKLLAVVVPLMCEMNMSS